MPVVPPSPSSSKPAAPLTGGYGLPQGYGGGDEDYEEANVRRRIRRDGDPGTATLMDYLLFRRMIVPIIVQILFWLGILGSVVFSVVQFSMGIANINRPGSTALILTSPLILIIGPLLSRVYAELLIVIFRINETLTEIREELKKRPPS